MDNVVEFFMSRDPGDLGLIALIIAGWLGFLVLMRWLYRRLRKRENVY